MDKPDIAESEETSETHTVSLHHLPSLHRGSEGGPTRHIQGTSHPVVLITLQNRQGILISKFLFVLAIFQVSIALLVLLFFDK